MRERLLAPAGVLATSPKATVSHVRATVSMAYTPTAPNHSNGEAVVRKPNAMATAITRAPLTRVRPKLPRTCPLSTEVRVIAMVRNLAMMPSFMSVHTLMAGGLGTGADGHQNDAWSQVVDVAVDGGGGAETGRQGMAEHSYEQEQQQYRHGHAADSHEGVAEGVLDVAPQHGGRVAHGITERGRAHR